MIKKRFSIFSLYLRERIGFFVFIISLVVLYSTCSRLSPLIFGYAIDNAISKFNLDLLIKLSVAYLFLDILKLVLSFLTSYLSQKLGNHLMQTLQSNLVEHIQKLPLSFFERHHSGSLITRLTTDANRLSTIFTEGIQTFVVSGIELLSVVVALCYVNIPLTLLTFLSVPPLLFVSSIINRKVRDQFLKAKKILSELNFFTLETIKGLPVLKTFNHVEKRKGQFFEKNHLLWQAHLGVVRWFANLWPLLSLFNAVTVSLALGLSFFFYKSWGLSIGEVSAFVLLLQSFFNPLQDILDKYNHIQDSFSSALRVEDLLGEEKEKEISSQKLKKIEGKISFENVGFKYNEDSNWVIKDMSFDIQPGEKVALIGKTGSGKSTLVHLLQNFYTPQKGDIKIDGVSLKDLNKGFVRSQIGFISQKNFLFKGTLLENITLQNKKREDFKNLLQKEELEMFQEISKSTKPLDFLVEEEGRNLSAGEKQIVEILRCFIFKPSVLIFDEATSNLDYKTERNINEILFRLGKNKTVIYIAHRVQSFKNFDRIFVIDDGKLLENDTHEKLVRKKGLYFQIIKSFPVKT